jgi:hypothetical protein
MPHIAEVAAVVVEHFEKDGQDRIDLIKKAL